MIKAVYPGSFDPITNGHLNIINRASKLYDELIVLVAISPAKKPFFSIEEKVNMIKDSVKDLPNVKVDFYEGLVVDYASKNNVQVLVRGLRAVSDFEYEFQLAAANRFINNEIEMVFFMANSENNFISSSMIKEMALAGQDVSSLVPPMVTKYLKEEYSASFGIIGGVWQSMIVEPKLLKNKFGYSLADFTECESISVNANGKFALNNLMWL